MARPKQTATELRKALTKPFRGATQDALNNATSATPPITTAKPQTRQRTREALPARADKIDRGEAPPSKTSKKRTRNSRRDDDDEDEHEGDSGETPPPKRARKENKSTSETVPIDGEKVPESRSKSKVRTRKITEKSDVVDEEVDLADEDVKSQKGKEKFALSLFYGETASKQRHAKRIFCIRSAGGPGHVLVAKESGTLQEGWGDRKTSINIFLEGDIANTGNRSNKCHIGFRYATHRAKATMGQVRSQIAQALGIKDIYSVQLESSDLAATSSTFREDGKVSVCNRVNAIWDDIQYTDDTLAKEALPHAKSPWLRVRKAEYVLISLPHLGLIGCVTPSETAILGDLLKIAASIGKSDLPRSFRMELIGGQKLRDDAADLRAFNLPHKAIITCTQEVHECCICEEQVDYLDWPENISPLCMHEVTSCTPCLQDYITTALDENRIDNITCPECEEVMDHSDLRDHTTNEEFARYDYLLARATLNDISNFRWCIGPKCDSGQIYIPEKGCTDLTCHACDFKACTACDRPYHEGETCEQHAARKKRIKDDRATAKTVAKISKECPGCGRAIQWYRGCDHMTCPGRECHTEFCWRCRGLWPHGHSTTCAHHPDFRAAPPRPG